MAIQLIKAKAREANRWGDMKTVKECIDWLEQNWHDNHAAQAFYTELERDAYLKVPAARREYLGDSDD